VTGFRVKIDFISLVVAVSDIDGLVRFSLDLFLSQILGFEALNHGVAEENQSAFFKVIQLFPALGFIIVFDSLEGFRPTGVPGYHLGHGELRNHIG